MRIAVKILLIFLLFNLVPVAQVMACCGADYVTVYPREGGITRNPVFLIQYNEPDFKLSGKINELEFYLLVNSKCKVPVNILQKVSGLGKTSQLLLKATGELHLGDSVQLQVIPKLVHPVAMGAAFMLFQRKIDNKWQVTYEIDREPVSWLGAPSWKYAPSWPGGSVFSHSVDLTYQISDSNPVSYEYMPGKQTLQQLFEVEIDGRKFFSIGGYRDSFSIYHGDCGGNFQLNLNQTYEASITALDFSGNRSAETRKVSLNTHPPKSR